MRLVAALVTSALPSRGRQEEVGEMS